MAGQAARAPDWAVRALAARERRTAVPADLVPADLDPVDREVPPGPRPKDPVKPHDRREGEGARTHAGAAGEPLLPVLPALHPLLPGLRRGQVVCVPGGPGAGGSRSGALPWALAAQACAEGAWCAAVGLPEAGVLAAVDLGLEVDRLVLVDEPGERWADVVAALLAAVDVVVVRPPRRLAPALVRRLTGLARQHGAVLVSVGEWEGASVRLRVVEASWVGIGVGHGRLAGRRARVEVSGRGAGVRAVDTWLWLPGPDGRVTAAAAPAAARIDRVDRDDRVDRPLLEAVG